MGRREEIVAERASHRATVATRKNEVANLVSSRGAVSGPDRFDLDNQIIEKTDDLIAFYDAILALDDEESQLP